MTQISRDTLMAYADGQLSDAERAAVELYCVDNPDAAAEVALLHRQTDAIRTLFGPAAGETVPLRLKPRRIAAEQKQKRWRVAQQAAMVVLVLAVGVVAGWFLRMPGEQPRLYDQLIANAVSAHTVYIAENRHAVEVGGDDADHLSSWLSNRLETALAMPDLTAQGLTFLGGRLLPAPAIAGGRAAQLMYEDAGGERLTLYITPSTGVDGPEYEAVAFGVDTALYWANALITCTIVGNAPPQAMQAIASAVFAQLGPDQTPVYRDGLGV